LAASHLLFANHDDGGRGESLENHLASLEHVKGKLGYVPDIYYVIMDGYARSDTLKRDYGYDNSQFEGFLKEKGFHVIEDSRSNYRWTFLSLASSLNMEHLVQ